MEGYAIVNHGEPLQKVQMPTPVPKGREVLLAVTHAGICHSDLHVIEGHYDLGSRGTFDLAKRGLTLPVVPGHEVVGKVISWGPDAESEQLAAGAMKLVFPWIGCGICARCQADEQNMCLKMRPMGVATNGGYATHILVPDPKYLLDIEGIDPALASTYACSGITVYGAIRKLMPLVPGQTVTVIGCGGLGLNAIALLRALGQEQICAVDVGADKLQTARELGATATVLAGKDSDATTAAIVEACNGVVLSVIDTVNGSATARFAFDALSKGGKLIQVGLFGGELKVPLPLITSRAVTLQGSVVGGLVDMRAVLELARGGSLPSIPITRRPLSEANAALDDLKAGRVAGRVVLVIDQAGAPDSKAAVG